ncbi:cysteine synthase A [Syntrophaceticus schinkii]|uniref:Cysteine synthase n=1 Tax=Syntrophaceticus schinkii TaxID=499207 RepID=A0A0B7MQY9_9FIRM|nr:cysteine synthase A [Syntrophaceticus schinkii]CEO90421.1 cysteine synthase A, O-acetylserine sulfhydrolase A subunit [Syntrophaceticus schinkii]
MKVANSIEELIGRTPVIQLGKMADPKGARVLVKLEFFNPAGSIKDRVALQMVRDAEKTGKLKPGGVIVEPTSGNTGIGLAMVAAARGYTLIIVMPETMSIERQKLIRGLGAELVLTPGDEGMTGAVNRAQEMLKKHPDYVVLQQFENPANAEAHRLTTGPEIIDQVGKDLAAFVCGVGTGGTLTGTGSVLKEKLSGVKVIAVEPAGSPVLSGGKEGTHNIQGIGAGFIPPVLDQRVIDQVIRVEDEEALITARRMMREEGIMAGISSGAAVFAAIKIAATLSPEKAVLAIAPDTGERYLSTALFE